MRVGSPFDALHAAVAAAVIHDIPDIEYWERNWEEFNKLSKEDIIKISKGGVSGPGKIKHRRPTNDEVSVIMFPQLWGSGSLGYGGMGTTSTVAAYTVIVTYKTKHFVYFGEGGRLAYCIDESIASLSGISNWRNDIGMRNIAPISKMSRYE